MPNLRERLYRWALLYVDFSFYLGGFIAALILGHARTYWLGVAIAIPGFVLWFVAKIQLGASFQITAEAKQIVRRGLYSKFRHPIYLFSTIAMIGIALCFGYVAFYGAVLFTVIMQLLRIRNEERVLREAFGEDYEQYRRETWF